jgi:hypothetical protein
MRFRSLDAGQRKGLHQIGRRGGGICTKPGSSITEITVTGAQIERTA